MIPTTKTQWLIIGVLGVLSKTAALECYSCQNVKSFHTCNSTSHCSDDQACFLSADSNTQNLTFSMGCLDNQKCGSASSGTSGVLVGRRQTSECHECCSTDYCNSRLCSHLKPSACVDDEQEDCARLHSMFNVCNDISHAKLICPKFCHLCDVVDGNWTAWTTWSSCDVSCGHGTQTRSRTCTNPVPQHGGANCIGNPNDVMVCLKDDCPVHGGWSLWASWGECSSSCDFGIQRRDRSCSNPYPSRFGDNCYGESRDDRICIMTPCADGGWSLWLDWDSCSVTCGSGLKRRHRMCNNPKPSPMGSYCEGSSENVAICNLGACRAGGWAAWSAWSTCSLSCGGGIHSRSRSCTNPPPSEDGQFCIGDSSQTQTCNSDNCPLATSAFSVDTPSSTSSGKLTFSNVVYNRGGDFNPYSGTFTCRISGTYIFFVDLLKKRSNTRIDMAYCYIYKNSSPIRRIHVDPTDDDTDKGSAAVSSTVIISLQIGDNVSLQSCTAVDTFESYTAFAGALLYPDI